MFKNNAIKSTCVKRDNRKPIKSGMSYEQALNEFTSTGKPWGDYWEMQQDWAFFVDDLVRDDLVDYEEARWWDNPCTPQTFREWINSSKKPIKSKRYSEDDKYYGKDSPLTDGKSTNWVGLNMRITNDLDDFINDMMFKYQKELGIKTGDVSPEMVTKLDNAMEDFVGKCMDVLMEQFEYNR